MTILLYGVSSITLGAAVVAALVVSAIVIVNLIIRLVTDASLPAHLPWAGVEPGGGYLARARANLSGVFNMKTLLDDGYYKYSKQGQTYVLPHILTGPEVILPLSQVRWLTEQPDSVLSQQEVNRQFLEADHTFLHPNIVREPVHPGVIRRELTHRLGSFADDIIDELARCLEEDWGTDTEAWREVRVYDTMLDVISRLSTRVFVGEELCANKDFLRSARRFDKNVVVSAAALNLLPEFLKPVLAPFVSAYDYFQYRVCAKHAMPLITGRLRQLSPNKEYSSSRYVASAPNDYFQWAIDHALAHPDPAELDASVIAKRLACLCFAAIQSSVISITNTLFDVAASPHCETWQGEMRTEILGEIARAEAEASSPWSKAALARMTRVDSALRESMRLNGFVTRGIMKKVVARDGVTLPDGSHVPCGIKVGVQAYSIHRDNDVYRGAAQYDAFRFVQDAAGELPGVYESLGSASGSETERLIRQELRKRKGLGRPQALVSTSPTFLAFSHGPNACPGRFFAANQLKLTLAHIAIHYEIEPVAQRPVNRWFVGSMAPPMWETLRVRRRRLP